MFEEENTEIQSTASSASSPPPDTPEEKSQTLVIPAALDIHPEINILDIQCPLTWTIFLNPVEISCGDIFEFEAINHYLKFHSKCPCCAEAILVQEFAPAFAVKNRVDIFLKRNPEQVNRQFFSFSHFKKLLSDCATHLQNFKFNIEAVDIYEPAAKQLLARPHLINLPVPGFASLLEFLCFDAEGEDCLEFINAWPSVLDSASAVALNHIIEGGPWKGRSALSALARNLESSHPYARLTTEETLNHDNGQGDSALWYFCRNIYGQDALEHHIVILEQATEEGLNRRFSSGDDDDGSEGSSPLSELCASSCNYGFLKWVPEVLEMMTPETLNYILPITNFEHGMGSIFTCLCSAASGIELLELVPSILDKMTVEALNDISPECKCDDDNCRVGISGLYWLCRIPEGIALLKSRPDILEKISPETVNRIILGCESCGESILSILCSTPAGRELLKRHPTFLSKADPVLLSAILAQSQYEDYFGENGVFSTPETKAILQTMSYIQDNLPLSFQLRLAASETALAEEKVQPVKIENENNKRKQDLPDAENKNPRLILSLEEVGSASGVVQGGLFSSSDPMDMREEKIVSTEPMIPLPRAIRK